MRLILIGMLTVAPVTGAVAAEKPNIVLVIADDMAWNDCGAYGCRSDAGICTTVNAAESIPRGWPFLQPSQELKSLLEPP